MTADCKCACGHRWSCELIAYEPDVNYIEVEDEACPQCGKQDFVVDNLESDD